MTSTTTVEIQGTLQPDGTLVLDEKPQLPPGRVRVTVRSTAEPPAVEQFQRLLHTIRTAQQARAHLPRSAGEIEQDRRALNEEMDRELEEAGRLQEESRRLRQHAHRGEGKQS